MKEILVTGGAGYIGSHVVKILAEKGFKPIVYDNLINGFQESVKDYEFIKGDIGDYDTLASVFKKHDIECVMNFSSFIAVGESVELPLKYYENNVSKTITLFKAMKDSRINSFIFSSTAAVYGFPDTIPITENTALNPINPYGRTKFFLEEILRDLDKSDNFKSICLRYFNVAGADESGKIGESHSPETHLIPLVIRAVLDPDYELAVFGTDYKTHDGTCIRDYIHVNDLASAHILALDHLLKTGESNIFNLGNGKGFTVREIIDSVKRVTGKTPKVTECPRREGDPDVLVASSEKALRELKWKPQFSDIDKIVETAWKWESSGKRKGY
jgi:UDP-glucose 4-epimerase